MNELENEINQLNKLLASVRMYLTASQNLRDGNNGTFTKRMKLFKHRLFKEISDHR